MGENISTITRQPRSRENERLERGKESDVTKAAKKAYKAFYSKGVSGYFNGGGDPAKNERAYAKYQKAMEEFKKAFRKKLGHGPAFDDYLQAMNEIARGQVTV